jgi:hypothetical protein
MRVRSAGGQLVEPASVPQLQTQLRNRGLKEKHMSVQPNAYTLKGGHITFVYFPAEPIDRRAEVIYTDAKETKTFIGTAIRVERVAIGTLVTVNVERTIDNGSTDFSVLLPDITLADAKNKVTFHTDGIVTKFKGPDSAGRGVIESYEFIPMTGTAESVVRPLTATSAKAV